MCPSPVGTAGPDFRKGSSGREAVLLQGDQWEPNVRDVLQHSHPRVRAPMIYRMGGVTRVLAAGPTQLNTVLRHWRPSACVAYSCL